MRYDQNYGLNLGMQDDCETDYLVTCLGDKRLHIDIACLLPNNKCMSRMYDKKVHETHVYMDPNKITVVTKITWCQSDSSQHSLQKNNTFLDQMQVRWLMTGRVMIMCGAMPCHTDSYTMAPSDASSGLIGRSLLNKTFLHFSVSWELSASGSLLVDLELT